VVVDMNAPAAHVAQHKWQPNTPDGHGTPFLFQHRKVTAGSAGGTLMRMFKATAASGDEWRFPQAVAFSVSGIRSQAIVSITCDKEIITGKSIGTEIICICCLCIYFMKRVLVIDLYSCLATLIINDQLCRSLLDVNHKHGTF
jgi:hypothetical protein